MNLGHKFFGGSALFMAHILDIVAKGKIFSIDIDNTIPEANASKNHVCAPVKVRTRLNQLPPRRRAHVEVCLVVLDSNHSKAHVLKETQSTRSYVSVGSYLIVADTNINGHPTFPGFGEGPFEAVEEFLDAPPK